MKLTKNIPNVLTFINLTLGFLAIIFSFESNFKFASIMILVAVVIDFFDGKIARIFYWETKMGEELDSLADLVSFGIAPAVMMYTIFQNQSLLVLTVLYVLASGFRLARFNIMKKQVEGFIGMPITTNGIIFPALYFAGANLNIVAIIFLISAILMVSTFKIKKVI